MPLEIISTDSVPSPGVFRSDAVAFVSYFDEKANFPEKYYKGIITVDSTIIVIFDKNNVGKTFYNISSLESKPFKLIERATIGGEGRIISLILIEGDSLYIMSECK